MQGRKEEALAHVLIPSQQHSQASQTVQKTAKMGAEVLPDNSTFVIWYHVTYI
jgi:hypothetical protein